MKYKICFIKFTIVTCLTFFMSVYPSFQTKLLKNVSQELIKPFSQTANFHRSSVRQSDFKEAAGAMLAASALTYLANTPYVLPVVVAGTCVKRAGLECYKAYLENKIDKADLEIKLNIHLKKRMNYYDDLEHIIPLTLGSSCLGAVTKACFVQDPNLAIFFMDVLKTSLLVGSLSATSTNLNMLSLLDTHTIINRVSFDNDFKKRLIKELELANYKK